MKEFSQWPTFPQVYINGEFYGGCDIMIGMQPHTFYPWRPVSSSTVLLMAARLMPASAIIAAHAEAIRRAAVSS